MSRVSKSFLAYPKTRKGRPLNRLHGIAKFVKDQCEDGRFMPPKAASDKAEDTRLSKVF